jgi:hypothetical protein
LPGSTGRRLEWVNKPPDDLGLTDLEMSTDPFGKGGKRTTFPTGTKSLDLVVRFRAAPPDGTRITAEVRGKAGSVGLKGGPLITAANNATGEFDVLLMCAPETGGYEDGPYQTRVFINGSETGLLNWSVGGAPPGPVGSGGGPAPKPPGEALEVVEWHALTTRSVSTSAGNPASLSRSGDVFVAMKVRLPARLLHGNPENGRLTYSFSTRDFVLKSPDGGSWRAEGMASGDASSFDVGFLVIGFEYGNTETDPPSFDRRVLFAVPRQKLEAGGLEFQFQGQPPLKLPADRRTPDRAG